MKNYSERILREKAELAGYRVTKGFQHYMYNGCIVTDDSGKRLTGYMVQNLSTGLYEWGCYDSNFDHLWQIEDVEKFLKNVYDDSGIDW